MKISSKYNKRRNLLTKLSVFQEDLILSVSPKGSRIIQAQYFDNYNLPCPIKVTVGLHDASQVAVVLRTARHGDVRLETELLRTLSRLGLPVSNALSVPKLDPDAKVHGYTAVFSLLSGKDLQTLAMSSSDGLKRAIPLLVAGIKLLESVTQRIEKTAIGRRLPHNSLIDQLNTLSAKNPWMKDKVYRRHVELLRPILQSIKEPLVFSNGDYQPANFLASGNKITGIVDFESACFHDPLIGLAKYPIYDLRPLNKAGFVKYFLKRRGFNAGDFQPRLALGCLLTLKREVPIRGGSRHDQMYRRDTLKLLRTTNVD